MLSQIEQVKEIAGRTGLCYHTVYSRLVTYGWSAEESASLVRHKGMSRRFTDAERASAVAGGPSSAHPKTVARWRREARGLQKRRGRNV